MHSKEERGLAAECKGNKNSLQKKSQDGRRLIRVRIFFSANILSPKCELQSVSSLLLQYSSRSLSKAMPRSERGREKTATFSSLQNGWGPGESSSEQRGRVVLPVLLRGGLGNSVSISPPFPLSSLMPFVPFRPDEWRTAVLSVHKKLCLAQQAGEGYDCIRVRLIWFIVCLILMFHTVFCVN